MRDRDHTIQASWLIVGKNATKTQTEFLISKWEVEEHREKEGAEKALWYK